MTLAILGRRCDGVGLSRSVSNWAAQWLQTSVVSEDRAARHRDLLQSVPAGPFERKGLRD